MAAHASASRSSASRTSTGLFSRPSAARLPRLGEVAQSVEHTAENRGVAGSIPALATLQRALGQPARFPGVASPDTPKPVAVIGAALDLGAGRRGVDMGPSAIRYAGLA